MNNFSHKQILVNTCYSSLEKYKFSSVTYIPIDVEILKSHLEKFIDDFKKNKICFDLINLNCRKHGDLHFITGLTYQTINSHFLIYQYLNNILSGQNEFEIFKNVIDSNNIYKNRNKYECLECQQQFNNFLLFVEHMIETCFQKQIMSMGVIKHNLIVSAYEIHKFFQKNAENLNIEKMIIYLSESIRFNLSIYFYD